MISDAGTEIKTETKKFTIPVMPTIQGWEEFLSDGEGFLRTAQGGYQRRKDVFTPEVIYNLVAMAIEKFVMAALMQKAALPYNHTMIDLVQAMDTTFPGRIDGIRKELLKMDEYQQICDPWDFTIIPPEEQEIPAMLDLADKLKQLTEV